jgi:hypothetical protein
MGRSIRPRAHAGGEGATKLRGQVRSQVQLGNEGKKVENHEHSIALHFMHYNFCRIHGSLRVTPAMEAGVADHVWSLEEVVALLD